MIEFRCALALTAMLLAPQVGQAASQQVYRCGPEGRTYSQTPCKDGYAVNTDDARTAEQRKAAEAAVKREAKMAEKMAEERQAKEAAAAKQAPTIIGPTAQAAKPAASAASSHATKPRKKPQSQTALQP
jgi:hypothetical protein